MEPGSQGASDNAIFEGLLEAYRAKKEAGLVHTPTTPRERLLGDLLVELSRRNYRLRREREQNQGAGVGSVQLTTEQKTLLAELLEGVGSFHLPTEEEQLLGNIIVELYKEGEQLQAENNRLRGFNIVSCRK